MELFDTHAHYNDEKFGTLFPGGLTAALTAAKEAGVTKILNCSTCPENAETTIALAETYPEIYAAVGIHPEDCFYFDSGKDPCIIDAIEKYLSHKKVLAVGEIGLDYHYPDATDKDRQFYYFDTQLSLAERWNLPVVVHDRDAHGDTFDMIRAHPNVIGVMHSYSGSPEMARQYANLGWYISFSGPVTYKNADKVREAVKSVPHDRILIETDCPYLPPVPYRGKINHSGYLPYTCQAVADVLGLSLEETARLTTENGMRLFGL